MGSRSFYTILCRILRTSLDVWSVSGQTTGWCTTAQYLPVDFPVCNMYLLLFVNRAKVGNRTNFCKYILQVLLNDLNIYVVVSVMPPR